MTRDWVLIEGGVVQESSPDVLILDMDILSQVADEETVDEVNLLLERAEDANHEEAIRRCKEWLDVHRHEHLQEELVILRVRTSRDNVPPSEWQWSVLLGEDPENVEIIRSWKIR